MWKLNKIIVAVASFMPLPALAMEPIPTPDSFLAMNRGQFHGIDQATGSTMVIDGQPSYYTITVTLANDERQIVRLFLQSTTNGSGSALQVSSPDGTPSFKGLSITNANYEWDQNPGYYPSVYRYNYGNLMISISNVIHVGSGWVRFTLSAHDQPERTTSIIFAPNW